MWLYRCMYARAWLGSRVSNYPRLQNDAENTCRAAFQPLFTSGMQLQMFCRVLRAARLRLRFVVVLRGDPRRRRGTGSRSEMLISRTQPYAIIRPLAHNREFMIRPETSLCFPRMRVSRAPTLNTAKIQKLIR